nr:hypothetical protein [Tanacetum cinerariifolium]
PWGCVFELGKVVGSWEKWWVRWRKAGKWSSGVKTVGGKKGQKCYSTPFKTGGMMRPSSRPSATTIPVAAATISIVIKWTIRTRWRLIWQPRTLLGLLWLQRIGVRPLGFQLLSCQQHRNQTLEEAEPIGAISP